MPLSPSDSRPANDTNSWLREQIRTSRALATAKFRAYRPYPKQEEFYRLGAKYRERVMLAGNQLGKTMGAAHEAGLHATGKYTDDWEGKRFRTSTTGWVGSESFEVVREAAQTYLLGERGQWGTGAIPASAFEREPVMSRVYPGLVDKAYIKHESGGISTISFKAYNQGRQKWQGKKVDWIWLDEEPPSDIYSEALARITASGGMIFMTMTPLLGLSDVVEQFYPEPNTPDRALVMMGIEDAKHLEPEEREQVILGYRRHEREARAEGIPLLGSGKVFDFPRADLSVDPFPIPSHWPRIGGIDFGYGDHPTGMCQVAWDRDSDCVYLTQAVKMEQAIPALHASVMRAWGEWVPVSWPHDGHKEWGDSLPYVTKYLTEGVKMLASHALFPTGGYSTEAGIYLLYDRMLEGRFKAFANLEPFWHEFSTYHRKNGILVKRNDDILSSLRMAVMMLRFARTKPSDRTRITVTTDYDEFGDYLGD